MSDLREGFAALHTPGNPVLLYNIWDVGSAQAVAAAGAKALATGSQALAKANGYPDGEAIPMELFLDCVRRIVAGVTLPVTADFEGGFAAEPSRLAEHALRLAGTGVIGCNFEDQKIGGEGLYPVEEQARRIAAVAQSGVFVNARTDLFLKPLFAGKDPNDRNLIGEALERAAAYKEAGARCFFIPGASETAFIAEICEASPLPVNVMMRAGMDAPSVLAGAGTARISWGPGPWRDAMAQLEAAAKAAMQC